ncbi:MAG TPA: hypothetical protein VEB66_02375 [Opitutaceae bacterium]|nr:hypothetical protein [Opitutaceae bacterium]
MSFPRLSLFAVDKWIFGVSLQFERCGCKHLDICVADLVVRIDFGRCRHNREIS